MGCLIVILFLQALFPDNTYGVDSGGDPQVIPNLTFEEFKVGFPSIDIMIFSIPVYMLVCRYNCKSAICMGYDFQARFCVSNMEE